MSFHLQMCSLSYKGYPRGVKGRPDVKMMVSAIMNVLALRFSEGNTFYAFCTNFPEEGEVKNLAQVRNSHHCIVFSAASSPGRGNGGGGGGGWYSREFWIGACRED